MNLSNRKSVLVKKKSVWGIFIKKIIDLKKLIVQNAAIRWRLQQVVEVVNYKISKGLA